MVKRKKRKKRTSTKYKYDYTNEAQYEKESLFSSIMQTSTGQFIFIFIVGWAYVALWMNTSYYDHSTTFMNQPNLLIAYIPPWVFVFAFMLYVKPIEMIGKTILTHVIASLIISFFVVGCSIGVMLIGLIILSPLGFFLG